MNRLFSWSRWFGIVGKEFIQLKRDRLTFAMIVGIPVLQLVLFGFAINSDPKHMPAAIHDAAPWQIGFSCLRHGRRRDGQRKRQQSCRRKGFLYRHPPLHGSKLIDARSGRFACGSGGDAFSARVALIYLLVRERIEPRLRGIATARTRSAQGAMKSGNLASARGRVRVYYQARRRNWHQSWVA